jgi:cytochrome b
MQRLKLPMRVWDLPTRVFHWGIVILVATSYVSISEGWMQVHLIAGYVMLGALVFRLIWGFAGSDTARFARFLKRPGAAFAHLGHMFRREEDREIGHNPAGGWMVVVMLLVLAVQVGTGLCANTDDSFFVNGPLAVYVGKGWSDRLKALHAYNFNLLLGLIGLHVLAVLAYAVLKRQDLVRPMITGKKRLPGATRQPRMASPLRVIAVVVVAVAVAAGVANLPQ